MEQDRIANEVERIVNQFLHNGNNNVNHYFAVNSPLFTEADKETVIARVEQRGYSIKYVGIVQRGKSTYDHYRIFRQ